MNNKKKLLEAIQYLQEQGTNEINIDEEAFLKAHEHQENNQSLAIKILSIFGGLLASSAFLIFLLITGLYDSGPALFVSAATSFGVAVWINKVSDRFILDTLSVAAFIIACILLGLALDKVKINEYGISISFMLVAIFTLIYVRNYILSFLSVLLFTGSILFLILSGSHFVFIHLYIVVLSIMLTYFYLKEARILTKRNLLSELYNPLRIGLLISFLAGLIILVQKAFFVPNLYYTLFSSIVIICAVLFVLSRVIQVLMIDKKKERLMIYLLSALILLPTALYPSISGALLIILLSFWVNYKTAFVMGILALIYFISQYYYDLNISLLIKSIILFSSGLLFLLLYLLIHKKTASDEKI